LQQQQQQRMLPHAVLTAGDPAAQPATTAGQPAVVFQQSGTAVAPRDGTGLTQPATTATAGAAAAAAAAEGSDEESSDDEDDAWGCGVGVFSQAAAAAHIKRVGQQLDDAFRSTPGARHRQQQPSQPPPPLQQQQRPASQQQIPAALPTPPPAVTAANSTQPGSAGGTSSGPTQNTVSFTTIWPCCCFRRLEQLFDATWKGLGLAQCLLVCCEGFTAFCHDPRPFVVPSELVCVQMNLTSQHMQLAVCHAFCHTLYIATLASQ
jgi:hypothetical protein